VNSVTKQGGNQLHGEVYFYHRGDEFSSKNEKTTLPNPVSGGAPIVFRPKDKRNQYGFGVGGPLIKNKLFFFYAFDAFRRNFPGTAVSGNPSALATACTSALLTATGTTAAQCASALADLQGDLGAVPRFGNQLINTPKLTWQINSKNSLDVYYHRLRWDSPGGVQTQAALSYARDAFGTDFVKLDYGVARLNTLVSSHVTNELRYQYARELNNEGQQPYTDYSKAHLMGTNGVFTYASISTSAGGFNVGSPYYSYRISYPDERKWQIGDTASWAWGRHSFRFGGDIDHNYDLQNNLFQSNGSYFYANPTLFLADILKPSGACLPLTASGTPTLSSSGTAGCHGGLTQGFGGLIFDLSTLDTAYFVQDDWKITPRLTINLGVRYDYEALPAPYTKAVATDVPQELNHPSDKNNIAPRLGFAFDPFGLGKTVVRGGFGLYYGRIPNAVLLNTYVNTGNVAGGGQASVTAYNGTDLDPVTPGVQAIHFPQTLNTRPAGGLLSVQYLDARLQNPYTEQIDLSVQQDLGHRNVLSVAYLGSLGRELPNYINANLDPTKFYTATFTTACNGTICNGIPAGTTFTQRVYSSRYSASGSNTLNKAYNAITDVLGNANSNYNALSVDITNRQWKLITFDANYTWAHALDYNVAQFTASGTNNYLDPFANGHSNYGNSNINIRHRAVGWAIVNIPGLQGTGPLTLLTNGWSIKPLVQVQSGLPYSYAVSTGSPLQQAAGTCSGPLGVNDCLQPYSSGIAGTGVSSYIPFFGRNTLTQPRDIVVDTRLQKDFRVREGISVQILAEGFNILNHRNITGVNTGAFSLANNVLTATTNFGTPSSSGVNGNYAYQVRQFQFGSRIIF